VTSSSRRLRRRDEEPRLDRAARPLVEGVPSPEKKGTTIEFGDAKQAVFVYKTIADPFAGRISCFRVSRVRHGRHDARRSAHTRRSGSARFCS
jgi:hypothetical protein